jgi:hypothetical protein
MVSNNQKKKKTFFYPMIVELLFKEFEMVRLQKKRSNDYVINSGGPKFFK